MKRGKRIAYALLSVALLSVSIWPAMKANAGVSETVLDCEKLDNSNWSNPEEDVLVEEGKLIFPESSNEYTRYISKSFAKLDKSFANLVKVSGDINFKNLPAGKSFVIGFGLSSIEAITGQPNNIEVTFTNSGGIKVGVNVYDDNGSAGTIAAPKSCGMSLNKASKVEVLITSDSEIIISVNGNNICSEKLPSTGEGRVGFMQTGECNVIIENLEVTHYFYDRPENANVFENFEKGAMDVSVLTSRMLDMYTAFPRGQMIEDYEGSQVFMFKNTGAAYIGGLYKYSNFELSFDVPYLQVETEYNEDGSPKMRGQSSFTISFGGEQADWDVTGGWEKAAEAIVYDKAGAYSLNSRETVTQKYSQDYFTNHERGFSVKISVVDGTVIAGIKWMDETQYETLLNYKLSEGMPSGYVHIWSTSVGQFAIDNLKIENLDQEPTLIETEYVSGKWEVPEDAVYEEIERVYASNDQTKSTQTISWYTLIPVATLAGAIILIVSIVVARSGHKTKKGAKADEN